MQSVMHAHGKIGHIQKVCHSQSTAVAQSAHSTDSAVATLSTIQEVEDIPPMFCSFQIIKFCQTALFNC